MNTQYNISQFGFGVVGKGFYQQALKAKIDVQKIVVKHNNKDRNGATDLISTEKNDVLNDESTAIVVEAINNALDAKEIVFEALKKGKHVVSANKKLIAENFEELVSLQKQSSFLYEASTAASIPIIRLLEQYFANEEIYSLEGILNGSSNYILSKIFEEGISYDEALKQAQENGFAEADPTLDVGGFDALNKLVILTAHAFGVIVKPENVFVYGIENISSKDVEFAKSNNLKIKLIAKAENVDGEITLTVAPQFVNSSENLFTVENEFNGIIIRPEFSGEQFLVGKGAGSEPTGAAVLADVLAVKNGFKYNYSKLKSAQKPKYNTEKEIDVFVRYTLDFELDDIPLNNVVKVENSNLKFAVASIKISDLIKVKNILQKLNLSLVLIGKSNIKQNFQFEKQQKLVTA